MTAHSDYIFLYPTDMFSTVHTPRSISSNLPYDIFFY
jgi:hypothetical protein